MKIQQATRDFTGRIALGTAAFTAVMLGVYLIIGRFSLPVFLGSVVGTLFSVLNFFLMCLSVQRAADKMKTVAPQEKSEEDPSGAPEEPEEETPQPLTPEARAARSTYQLSYFGRLAMIAAVAVCAHFAPWLDLLAALLPFLFPRLIIMIYSFTHKG